MAPAWHVKNDDVVEVSKKIGSPGRTRTCDLVINRRLGVPSRRVPNHHKSDVCAAWPTRGVPGSPGESPQNRHRDVSRNPGHTSQRALDDIALERFLDSDAPRLPHASRHP